MSFDESIVSAPFGICKVCQAPATGHHYGAVTCEACKGFFKRAETSIKDDGQQRAAWQKYLCYERGNCIINLKERARCRKCRHEKCVQVGMSLNHIHLGRRWNRKVERSPTESPSCASLPDMQTTVASIFTDVQGPPRSRSAEEVYGSHQPSWEASSAERHVMGELKGPCGSVMPTRASASGFLRPTVTSASPSIASRACLAFSTS